MDSQKLEYILNLARGAKNKNMSELTLEEKQAVYIAGNVRPCRVEKGKIKYDGKGKLSAWQGEAKRINAIIETLPTKIKGLNQHSIMVFMDEPFPEFIEVSFKEAVEAFPSWKIPKKDMEYLHLPPAQKVETGVPKVPTEFSSQEIGLAIAKVIIELARGVELDKTSEAIVTLAHDYTDDFKRLCKAVGLPHECFLARTPVEAPRGSHTYDPEIFTQSYVAVYIVLASRGKFLRKQ